MRGGSATAAGLAVQSCGGDADTAPPAGPLRGSLEPLAAELAGAQRDRVFDVVLRHLRDGRTIFDVLRAVLRAGAAELAPESGGWLHCVLAVNPVLDVAAAYGDDRRLVPVLWVVDRFKHSQQSSQGARLGAIDGPVPASDAAAAALETALGRWDRGAADAAVVSLVRGGDRSAATRTLQTYALRDQRWVGHTTIHAAQLIGALEVLGWGDVELPIRSLVAAMVSGHPGDTTETFDVNRARAAALGAGWDRGVYDDAAVADLVATARTGTVDELSKHVAATLGAGVSPQSAWDGLVVYAAELMMRAPDGPARMGALHAVTTVDAMRMIARQAADDSIQRLALLQAASWMALFRGYVVQIAADARLPMVAVDLVQLAGGDLPASADELVRTAAVNPAAGARAAIAWLDSGRPLEPVAQKLLEIAIRNSRTDEHDCKFPVAVLQQVAQAAPRWAPRVLSVFAYGRGRVTDPPWVRLAEAEAAAATAGPLPLR